MITIIERQEKDELEMTPIGKLGLSTRAANCLSRAGIKWVEQMVCLDARDVMRIKNMGVATFREISAAVKNLGLRGWSECDILGG